jgi:diguanylate cyclase (GGDEF)-like protein
MTEVFVAAVLLRPRDSVPPILTPWPALRRFLLYGVIAGPLCSAAVVQLLRLFGGPPFTPAGLWMNCLGDALGIALMTPAILAIQRDDLVDLLRPKKLAETIGLLAGLVIFTGAIFAQPEPTLTFLLFPAVMLIVFRLRSSGSAIGIFLAAIPAAYLTVHGRGPFSLARTGSLAYSVVLLEGFLCMLLVVVYVVSAELAERDRLQHDIIEAYLQADVMAGLDHLTGLANRRTFDKELSREWRRAVREHGNLSLLMIDIDHFKRYNDHYGHIAGDECLRTIASLLAKTMVRSNDLAARYGGEEFAIILPGSNLAGALMIADRLREAIARASLRHEASNHGYVTVSVGVATAYPTRTMEETQLVQTADTALYLAKRNGRNQVMIGSPRQDAQEPKA